MYVYIRDVPGQNLAGGGGKIFFSDLEMKPCALLGGFGGIPPPPRGNFFK